MSTAAITQLFPTGLALLGGIPTKSQDLAASIIFLVLYAPLIPVFVVRVAEPSSRCIPHIHIGLFLQARMVLYVIRAYQAAKADYSAGLFIAEQILLLSGYITLVEPFVYLATHHITQNLTSRDPRVAWTHRFMVLLQLMLLAAIALGIVAGTQYTKLNDPGTETLVKACRDANAIIGLVIILIVLAAVILSHFRKPLPVRQTVFLLVVGTILVIPSIFKVVLYSTTPALNAVGVPTKVCFYVLAALPELIVVAMLLGSNIKKEFGIGQTGPVGREEEEKEMGAPQV